MAIRTLTNEEKQGLHTPSQWAELEGIEIKDPDGWRVAGAPPFDQPTTFEDYQQRCAFSTIKAVDRPSD